MGLFCLTLHHISLCHQLQNLHGVFSPSWYAWWWCDNGKYKQGTQSPNTHELEFSNKNILLNFKSINVIVPPLCTFRMLLNQNYEILKLIWRNPHDDHDAIFDTFTRGLCTYSVRLFNDDFTKTVLSYWRKRVFPKLRKWANTAYSIRRQGTAGIEQDKSTLVRCGCPIMISSIINLK